MIVVIGQAALRKADNGSYADGLAARIAVAAAGTRKAVELVAKIGDDPLGDAVLLALARVGVGHVAVLRDFSFATPTEREPIDGDLAPITDDHSRSVAGELTQPPRRPNLEAADVELALRYLTDFSVLVLAAPADEAIARVVAAAAAWADARLIVVVPAGGAIREELPADAIVFEAPDRDADGAFADMVGAFAAALDDGDEPGMAFRATIESAGWAPTETAQD